MTQRPASIFRRRASFKAVLIIVRTQAHEHPNTHADSLHSFQSSHRKPDVLIKSWPIGSLSKSRDVPIRPRSLGHKSSFDFERLLLNSQSQVRCGSWRRQNRSRRKGARNQGPVRAHRSSGKYLNYNLVKHHGIYGRRGRMLREAVLRV